MGFAENLREARIAAGLTQQQVADAVCVHRTTYTKYETKGVEPPLHILRKLTVLLRVSADALLREETDPLTDAGRGVLCRVRGRRTCPICHRVYPPRRQ